ncbi:MAG TPA: site-specific integrase [Thermoleophilaceae bacterium]|nr:site-specific integrase [Thermoleophilaceae bacterium]
MARKATGAVVERQGTKAKAFALRFRAYGKREYLTLGTDAEGWTQARAEEELENVLADVRRGVWQPPSRQPVEPAPDPSFHEFASEWFDRHRQELRPRSREDYAWALSHHLLPFFAGHRLSEITVAEVDRYRARKLREGTLAPNTLNKTLTRLAQVLEVAVEYGYLTANPARGRRRRAKSSTPQRTWLEPEQVKPLLEGASIRGQRGGKTTPAPRMRALVATGVCAGLRVGELLALRWGEVDLASGRITVRAAKTDAGQRVVDLWPELREELFAWKSKARHVGHDDYVFATSTGKPDSRSNVGRALRRAVERANEELGGGGDAATRG